MARIVIIGSFAGSLVTFRGKLFQDLIACGHRVLACAPGATDRVQNQLESLGVEYRDIPLRRRGLNPFSDIVYMLRLVALLKQWKADMVLSYTAKPCVYGSLAARLAGVPYAVMITGLGQSFSGGSITNRIIDRFLRYLYRFALRKCRVAFFQNPDDFARFRGMHLLAEPSRVSVIPGSGIDINDFVPTPYPAQISFLLMARIIPAKGIYQYVRAAALLGEKYPAARFRLAGPIGADKAYIPLKEVQGWHRAGIVEYLGMLEDVKPALSECSVYVLPSYYGEGVPRSTLEAMACGRAIITTDAPGCRETVIDQKNGYLVPVRDVAALACAMEKFLKDPEMVTRMGAQSRQLAVTKFDVRQVNRLVLDGLDLVTYPLRSQHCAVERSEDISPWRDV